MTSPFGVPAIPDWDSDVFMAILAAAIARRGNRLVIRHVRDLTHCSKRRW